MVTNLKVYVTLDPDDYDAVFRYEYRDTMIAQFKKDLYNKKFSLQDQGKDDQIDTLQNRIKLWLNAIDDTGGSILPDNLYDYDYNDERLDHSVGGAEILLEKRESKQLLDTLRYKWRKKRLKSF